MQTVRRVFEMAGQTDRSNADQTRPTARRAAAGRPQANISQPDRVQVPIEFGPAPEPFASEALVVSSTSPLAHDTTALQFQTQAAYRRLITSGISGPEAAGLISYVVGLAPCESRWSLLQVNRLLFLRDLYRNTGWGKPEGAPVRKPD